MVDACPDTRGLSFDAARTFEPDAPLEEKRRYKLIAEIALSESLNESGEG